MAVELPDVKNFDELFQYVPPDADQDVKSYVIKTYSADHVGDWPRKPNLTIVGPHLNITPPRREVSRQPPGEDNSPAQELGQGKYPSG